MTLFELADYCGMRPCMKPYFVESARRIRDRLGNDWEVMSTTVIPILIMLVIRQNITADPTVMAETLTDYVLSQFAFDETEFGIKLPRFACKDKSAKDQHATFLQEIYVDFIQDHKNLFS